MNYASDKAQELTSGTKAEANKGSSLVPCPAPMFIELIILRASKGLKRQHWRPRFGRRQLYFEQGG